MRKSGFTLVELLAVMVSLFAVMGVSVVLLVQAIHFQKKNSAEAEGMRVFDRLAVDFRSDVHAFGKPEIPDDGALIQWKTDTETLRYVLEPGRFPEQQVIVRTLEKDGQKQIESYRLPERTAVWCVDGKATDANLAALSLWTVPPGTEMPPLDTINPFDRTIQKGSQADSQHAGYWRTIIARYNNE